MMYYMLPHKLCIRAINIRRLLSVEINDIFSLIGCCISLFIISTLFRHQEIRVHSYSEHLHFGDQASDSVRRRSLQMLQQSHRQFGHYRRTRLQTGNGRIDGKPDGVLFLLGRRCRRDQALACVEGKENVNTRSSITTDLF